MKLIGLMLVRNESWVLGCSISAALRWCDEVVVVDDDSHDLTASIATRERSHVTTIQRSGQHWDEMELRQKTLDIGRELGGTHFAIIDADEVLTANLVPHVRGWFAQLEPKQVLDVPMIACWKSLDQYAADIQSVVTLGFRDHPDLCWKPRGEEKYQHHARPPAGSDPQRITQECEGGVFHLQFANWDRFIWKHRHYMMSEKVRWNYPDAEINSKYHWFESKGSIIMPVPSEWWDGHLRELILNVGAPGWYEHEVYKMIAQQKEGTFSKLDLFGMKL